MKKNNLMILAIAFSAGAAARAQTAAGPIGAAPSLTVDVPALRAVAQLSEGAKGGDETFDGMPILRREPPLVILEEKKDVFLGKGRDSDRWSGSYEERSPFGKGERVSRDCDSLHHDSIFCTYHEGKPYSIYGTRQKVGIEDRETYVSNETKSGRRAGKLLGGFVGLGVGVFLGTAVLPALPGVLAGLAALAVCVVLGAAICKKIGARDAENKPRVFERDVDTRRVY